MTVVSAIGRRKRRAAALSIGSNTFLVLIKLVVGVLTGSVAVISEAVHSAMDLLAALIAFVAVSLSDRPPDQDHPHGHGKIENLSGAVEALLIFGAVVFIAYEAIDKLIHGNAVRQIYLGAIVMGISALVNTVVSWHLQRVGSQTDSEALLADAAHLRTDVYTSVGVFVGLLLVHFTGLNWLDPGVALLVALLIIREAWHITRRSVGVLLDESIPEEERNLVMETITRHGATFHSLRSRKSGATRTIDLHLDVSPKAPVEQVHELCDRIEEDIQRDLPGTQVLIHPEPDSKQDLAREASAVVEQLLEEEQAQHLGYSELHAHEHRGEIHISLHLRMRADLSLREANLIVEELTRKLQQHTPQIKLYIQLIPGEP